jgi:hypothetical protein
MTTGEGVIMPAACALTRGFVKDLVVFIGNAPHAHDKELASRKSVSVDTFARAMGHGAR